MSISPLLEHLPLFPLPGFVLLVKTGFLRSWEQTGACHWYPLSLELLLGGRAELAPVASFWHCRFPSCQLLRRSPGAFLEPVV
jgi:hypothetical protein